MRSSGTETLENGQTVTMQNTQVRFTEGVIIYTSRVTSPIEGDLRLVMQPYVVDGVMQLSLVSADLGGQTIPQFMVGMVETTLNATLNGAFSQLPGSVTLTALYVNEGSLTFVANRNG